MQELITLKKERIEPISDSDILGLLKTRVVTYSELGNYNNIEDLFINDSVVILYQPRKIGHWVCIVRNKNLISYFDSYGRLPDYPKYLSNYNTNPYYITKLLLNSDPKYTIEYNNYDLQEQDHMTATCGRHVIVRILMKDKNINEYYKFMKKMNKYMSNDDLVTFITDRFGVGLND